MRGPNDQQRTVILGRTGAGKSQFAWALMSTRNFHEIPWTIIDYKREDLIEDTFEVCKGGIKEIKVTSNPPKKPGLYRMIVSPRIDDDAVNAYLYKVYKQGNHGLLIDEGYALPQDRKSMFDIILTQGRSLHIPVIVLYQRPVWMSRFAIAQADYFAVFEQNDERDLKVTSQFVKPAKLNNGQKITVFDHLPKYQCLWHDVARGETVVLAPAPERQLIINRFVNRLKATNKKALV